MSFVRKRKKIFPIFPSGLVAFGVNSGGKEAKIRPSDQLPFGQGRPGFIGFQIRVDGFCDVCEIEGACS